MRHGFDGSEKRLLLKIARADVAAFVLAQVEDPASVRRAVSVSACRAFPAKYLIGQAIGDILFREATTSGGLILWCIWA